MTVDELRNTTGPKRHRSSVLVVILCLLWYIDLFTPQKKIASTIVG